MIDEKMRKAFEAQFPLPEGVHWDEQVGVYYGNNEAADQAASYYYEKFKVWQAAQRHGNDPLLFKFGYGDKVVDVGTYGEEHAVFIAPVVNGPGPVGVSSIGSEPQINDRLADGEKVMTFPTSEQAHAVCDALANKVSQYRKPPEEV